MFCGLLWSTDTGVGNDTDKDTGHDKIQKHKIQGHGKEYFIIIIYK